MANIVKRTKRSRLSKPKASARAKITAGSSTSLTASAGTRYLALPRMEEKCMVPPSTKRAKGVVRSANCPHGLLHTGGQAQPQNKGHKSRGSAQNQRVCAHIFQQNRRAWLSAAEELQNEHCGHVVDGNDDGDHHGRQGGSSRAVDAGGQGNAKEHEVAAVDGLDNHAAFGIFPDQPGDGKEQDNLQDQNTGDGKYHQLGGLM